MYYKNNITPPYSISENTISILWDGEPHIIARTSPNYHALKTAILHSDWDSIPDCLSTAKHFEVLTEGRVKIEGDRVLFNTGNQSEQWEELHNNATKKLLSLLSQGLSNASPWLKFIDKLMSNPSYRSREQLYNFLEHRHMPITQEGNVVGYKGVNKDYMDIYSGKFNNEIGKEHWMLRSNVDDDSNNGCSAGFHIGSHSYADSWGSQGKLMVVEFSPADAVSVPEDGSFEKLRVCRYKVIGESHSRKPVAEGLYSANSTQDRDTEITDWLLPRWAKGKSPRYSKLCKRFPGLTLGELEDALSNRGSPSVCPYAIDWDDNANDYRIYEHA